LPELYHWRPGIHITCIGDQGLEVVQIVIYRPASLVIGGAFQSIDCVHFLTKHVFRPLGSTTTFEECEGPKNPLFFVMELFQGQADVQGAGV